jgi:hypothetical protein
MRDITNKIKVKSLTTKITRGKWLNKLSHGHIILNTYVRPIVFISLEQSTTFLPLKLGPEDSKDPEPIYLVNINKNHWVLANFEAADGTKPIPPPFLAPKHTSSSAQAWLTFIQKGRECYNQDMSA